MPKYSRSQCTNTVKTRLDFHEFLLQDDRSDGLESERNADGGIRLDAAFHLRTRELFAQRFETHESPCHWQCGWILHRQRLSLPPTTQSYHYAHKCCLLGHCTVGTRRHWYSDYRHVWIGETKWSVPPGLWTEGEPNDIGQRMLTANTGTHFDSSQTDLKLSCILKAQ